MRRAWLLIGLMLAGCRPRAAPFDPLKDVLGVPYGQARRLLLAHGFKTAEFSPSDVLRRRSEICDDLEGQRCRAYPETWDCPSKGECEFDLVRASDGKVLALTTQGDLPPSVGEARWASDADVAERKIANR